MKRLQEHTDEELIELKDEEIAILIDLECAHEGVPMLPTKPVAPSYEKPVFDCKVFVIAGLVFTSAEDAGKVLEAINETTPYDTDGYNDDKRLTKLSEYGYPKIAPELIYSIEKWEEIKDFAARNKKEQRSYNKLKDVYDEAAIGREDVVTTVWDAIRLAQQKAYQLKAIKDSYANYLQLAGGDAQIAMNFLIKAGATMDNDLVYELCPDYKFPLQAAGNGDTEEEG